MSFQHQQTLTLPLDRSANAQGPMECGDIDGVSGEAEAAWISRPQLGKHICFDGRYLHGAPANLALPQVKDHLQAGLSSAVAVADGYDSG